MFTDYSVDTECENKDTCKLQAILTDNARLKAEIKEYRRKNDRRSNYENQTLTHTRQSTPYSWEIH